MSFVMQKRANEHKEIICNEIKATFENKILTRMGRNYLSDNTFIDLFMTTKVAALNEVSFRIYMAPIYING